MSKVVATTVLPEDSGEVLTFGDTGDAIAISGASLNLNVLQDAGGNNIITSDGGGTLTLNSGLGDGALRLLATNTFTGTTSSAFTTLIDSTYDAYIWKFNAINPETDLQHFRFNVSSDGGSNYNVTKTTTYFRAYHDEADTGSSLDYVASHDIAQGTGYQLIAQDVGSGADECAVGELWLFNPSSTTYVKNFYNTSQVYNGYDYSYNEYAAGYMNTTSAINAIDFKMDSGNMDGEIKMYGLRKS